MPNNRRSVEPGTSSEMTDRISDSVTQTKQKITELGSAAADKIDQNRGMAASGLDSAASAMHEKADQLPGGEKVSNLAHSAADKLSATADYVREHDIDSMMSDVEKFVKKNPGPAILTAVVIGFLVGRTFRRD